MPDNSVVVFCKTQKDKNSAIQKWVNEKKYKRTYTSDVLKKAGHFVERQPGEFDESAETLGKGFLSVMIFEK